MTYNIDVTGPTVVQIPDVDKLHKEIMLLKIRLDIITDKLHATRDSHKAFKKSLEKRNWIDHLLNRKLT